MMSDQNPMQTDVVPPLTQDQGAAWEQLKKDRDQLRDQLTVLERGHQDLHRFLRKARRHNLIACVLVALFTVAAWALDASLWLRWYVLPIALACSALLWAGGKLLDRLMSSKIASLSLFLEQADAQIEKGQSIYETDHPRTDPQP